MPATEAQLVEKILKQMEAALKARKKNGQADTIKEVYTLLNLCTLVSDSSKCTDKKRKYTKRAKVVDDTTDQAEPTTKKD